LLIYAIQISEQDCFQYHIHKAAGILTDNAELLTIFRSHQQSLNKIVKEERKVVI